MTTEATPYKADRKIENSKLPWKYLKTLASAQRQFTATIPVGQTKEHYMRPSYWDVVAIQLDIYSKIHVIAEDGSFYGEYLVIDCSRIHATLVELFYVDIESVTQETPAAEEEYKYAWKGPVKRHCVIRVIDDEIVKSEMPSKAECQQWIAAKSVSVPA
jgi:hypothetical protein